MKHQDGRCATDAETIYVQKTVACPGAAATADGSAAMPYCSMDPAVTAVGATRDLILVRGTVTSAATPISGASRQISIVGQLNAGIAGSDPGIHLSAGDLYVRSVKLGPSPALGCQAEAGSTLRLDHVVVTNNSGGGVLIDGAAFDIENTTVTDNDSGTFGVANWGGILVNNPPTGGPAKLQFVTIQNNKQVGVACSARVSGANVSASGNVGGDISSTCGFSSCGTASVTCGAQP
jgi:hypothetical protein